MRVVIRRPAALAAAIVALGVLSCARENPAETLPAVQLIVSLRSPDTLAIGEAFSVLVTVADVKGQPVTSATPTITLSLTNALGATLGGTTTKVAANAVALFSDLTVSKQGTGYTLTASVADGSLTAGTSDAFTVTPNPSAPAPRIYVTNSNSNTVSVISVATNAVVATIPVGANPGGIGITPNGSFVYVANYSANSVSVIATATNTVVATIPSVGGDPADIVVSPNGSFVYVANQSAGVVTVIATASNTIVGSVTTGQYTSNLAITPNGNFVYASTWASASNGVMKVIATATNAVVGSVTAGIYPGSMSFTSSGDFGYVSNLGRTVTKIATASNTVAATITLGTNQCGSTPAYCATPGGPGIALTPNGAFAYVTDLSANTVTVVNTATNAIATTVAVDSMPNAVVVIPDGTMAYVANYGGTTVKAINTATNTVAATITVGVRPLHLVVKP